MFASPKDVAVEVMLALEDSNEFEKVELIGSVKNDTYDDISDIDIVLLNSTRAPWLNVQVAHEVLKQKMGCMLWDWSGSLIPEKYLISHFLPNVNPMWWVDLGCYPCEQFGEITRDDILEDKNTHIAKLLLMNAKHCLRGTASRLKIDLLFEKVTAQSFELLDNAQMFNPVRQEIDVKSLDDRFVRDLDYYLSQISR